MGNSFPNISDIRYLITCVAGNSGLNYGEAVGVIENVIESVLYNKYDIFLDGDYILTAINKNDEADVVRINSVNDLKKIRQKILIRVTDEKKEYIWNLKSMISFKEIKDLMSKTINKSGTIALNNQVSYLLHKHIDGTILAETEGGYLVNINKINRGAHIKTEVKYKEGGKYRFFVDKIEKDFTSGELRIVLKNPAENKKRLDEKSLISKFQRGNGRIIKNKVAIMVNRKFARVYSVKNREVFYEKEFSDYDERMSAVITAAAVFKKHKNK